MLKRICGETNSILMGPSADLHDLLLLVSSAALCRLKRYLTKKKCSDDIRSTDIVASVRKYSALRQPCKGYHRSKKEACSQGRLMLQYVARKRKITEKNTKSSQIDRI